MYKINPTKYMGVTVLPSDIAEKHLILSSLNQLKVIIYAFSKPSEVFSPETISEGTGIAVEEVNDALSYWKDLGFILISDDAPVMIENNITVTAENNSDNSVTEALIPEKTSSKKKLPHNNPSKLTYSEICTRIGESEEIRILLNEAQMKLGRTIGTGDQSSLILLHDYYGLPVEVILSICEYAGTKGKSANMNYIYKIGVDWSHREIDNIEAADEELKNIEKVNSVWAEFSSMTGLRASYPTTTQEKYFSQWVNEWNFTLPVVALAFEEMKDHSDKISFPYMHRVLSAWHLKGINTPEKVMEDKENFRKEQEKKALKKAPLRQTKVEIQPDPTASYDIKRAEERALTSVPKLKKRERR